MNNLKAKIHDECLEHESDNKMQKVPGKNRGGRSRQR